MLKKPIGIYSAMVAFEVQQVLLRLVYRSSSAMKQRDAFVWLVRVPLDGPQGLSSFVQLSAS